MLFQLCLLTFVAVSLPTASPASPVRLLGEEAIEDVSMYAEKIENEGVGFLDSPLTTWDHVGTYDRGLDVFSRPVVDNKLLMVRSSVDVGKSAAELFDLLTSREGASILDDTTTHDGEPYAELQWRDRAWVTYSKTIPAKFPFGQRSFVKATFFDSAQNLLVSKSILYEPLPSGGDGLVRAFNSFALRTVPTGAQSCRLEVVDYFDMRGWFPTWIANQFHKARFCQGLHARLWRRLDATQQSVRPSSAASVS